MTKKEEFIKFSNELIKKNYVTNQDIEKISKLYEDHVIEIGSLSRHVFSRNDFTMGFILGCKVYNKEIKE